MLYLVNPSTAAAGEAIAALRLGAIMTPRQGNRLPTEGWYGADNGCGPGKNGKPGTGYPGDEAYLRFLMELDDADGTDPCDPDSARCLFAVAPDIVGDAAGTLRRSEQMLVLIRHYTSFPAALVAQDGLEQMKVPWDEFDALFIGGSTRWKLGPAAARLVAEARDRGKHTHMGRVNSLKRLRYAAAIGCDSADGTFLTFAPDQNLAVALGWDRDVNGQGALWDEGDRLLSSSPPARAPAGRTRAGARQRSCPAARPGRGSGRRG
jgi:hypothetical protein